MRCMYIEAGSVGGGREGWGRPACVGQRPRISEVCGSPHALPFSWSPEVRATVFAGRGPSTPSPASLGRPLAPGRSDWCVARARSRSGRVREGDMKNGRRGTACACVRGPVPVQVGGLHLFPPPFALLLQFVSQFVRFFVASNTCVPPTGKPRPCMTASFFLTFWNESSLVISSRGGPLSGKSSHCVSHGSALQDQQRLGIGR